MDLSFPLPELHGSVEIHIQRGLKMLLPGGANPGLGDRSNFKTALDQALQVSLKNVHIYYIYIYIMYIYVYVYTFVSQS